MKKAYVTPLAYFESYQVSSNIGGSCAPDHKLNHGPDSCTYKEGGIVYFMENVCELPADDVDMCYQASANPFFTS